MKKMGLLLAAASMAALLSGCGGSGHSSRAASVEIQVRWPESSRLVPERANWVKVEVFDGATLVAQGAVKKPGDTIPLANLPIGNLQFVARAFFFDDGGTGVFPHPTPAGLVPLAAGSFVQNLTPGVNQAVTFTMASTIRTLSFTLNPVGVGIDADLPIPVASDGANPVLISASKLIWTVGDSSIAAVHNIGDPIPGGGSYDHAVVTGVTAGSTVLKVKDSESQVEASDLLKVIPITVPVTVTVQNIPPFAQSVFVKIEEVPFPGETPLQYTTTANVSGVTTRDVVVSADNRGRQMVVTAEAWSNPDRTGGVFADGSVPLDLPSGADTATVPLASKIQALIITPNPGTVVVGKTLQMSVAADLAGPLDPPIPVNSSTLTWSRTNGAGQISINNTGLVTGQAEGGGVSASVADSYSGKSAAASIDVKKNTADVNLTIK